MATIQKQDVFLKAPGMWCLGQLMLLVPLFSVLCLPVEPWPPSHHSWQGHLLQGEALRPCPPCCVRLKMQTLSSDSKDKVPTFHNATRVPCPQMNACVKETVKKKKDSPFPLTGGILKYRQGCTSQLFFLPHKHVSFTILNKVKAASYDMTWKTRRRAFPVCHFGPFLPFTIEHAAASNQAIAPSVTAVPLPGQLCFKSWAKQA